MTKEQEQEVLRFHADGLSNRQISRSTRIAHKSIGAFLKHNNLLPNGTTPKRANFVDPETIICSKCNTAKYVNEFMIMRRNRPCQYRLSYCNDCRKKQSNANMNANPNKVLRDIYLRLVQRCKKSKLKMEITWEYFLEIYNKQSGICYFSGNEMRLARGQGNNWKCCTVDKVIPEKGYVEGNIIFLTKKYNTVKNNLTLEEIKTHMPNFYARLLSCSWLTLSELEIIL